MRPRHPSCLHIGSNHKIVQRFPTTHLFMSLCSKDPGIHRSEKETYLSSNHELVAGSTHGGLEEDVRDEEGNVGLGRSIGNGGGNVPSELDGLISGLGGQLPVTADEGLASVKLGGRSASEGGGGEGGGRSGEEGGNGELHGGIYESWWNREKSEWNSHRKRKARHFCETPPQLTTKSRVSFLK